jgi:NitT/TauT family transport system permease protein
MVSSSQPLVVLEAGEDDAPKVKFSERIPDWVLLSATFLVLLGLWQLAINIFNPPPYIIPSPTALGLALWSAATDYNLYVNVGVTAEEVAIAFCVAALLACSMGLLVTENRVCERIILPYVIAIQSVPKVAIAPLIIIWFGFGITSKIVIASMLAFFPIFVNVVTGFKAIDQRQLMLMRSLCASRWQIFFKLRLMTAFPYLFAGLQIAAVLASLGAIVGEFVGAKQGIGSMIIRSQTEMDVANVFVGVVALSIMVSILHASVKAVSKRVVFWTEFEDKSEA